MEVYHFASGCFSASWLFGGRKRVTRYPYYFRGIVSVLREWNGMFFLGGLFFFGCFGGRMRIARYAFYFMFAFALDLKETGNSDVIFLYLIIFCFLAVWR